MPAIEKSYKFIKVIARPSTIIMTVITEDSEYHFKNQYNRAEMDDFDKNLIEWALTAVAQGGALNIIGYYEGDRPDSGGPLSIESVSVKAG
ncbi:MAG: hypothetical protein ACTHLK_02850 [Brucella intermedia]